MGEAKLSPRRPGLEPGPIATGFSFAKSVCRFASSTDHAVWVPAFAGTTKERAHPIVSATRPIALRSINSRIARA